MNSVLEQFLAEEAVPYVRNLIFYAIAEHNKNSNEVRRRFEFNRFEITVDYVKSMVFIEDVLDPEASGEISLPLKEFLFMLADEDGQVGEKP